MLYVITLILGFIIGESWRSLTLDQFPRLKDWAQHNPLWGALFVSMPFWSLGLWVARGVTDHAL